MVGILDKYIPSRVNFQEAKYQTKQNLQHRTRCSASIIAAGMPIKMTVGSQIPPVTMAILASLQTINVGRSLEVKESP